MFVYPGQNKTQQARITRWLKEGALHRVGPRLYCSLAKDQQDYQNALALAVRSSWSEIISHLFPGALLSYRTALEFRPSPDESAIYITGKTNRELQYPGLKVVFIRGHEPLDDDPHFLNLRTSSLARALLENLSAGQCTESRSVSITTIEQRLENILESAKLNANQSANPEAAICKIRDRAREIANQFKWKSEFNKLDAMMGALLGTRSTQSLKSAEAQARSVGRPFEPARIEKFDLLCSELIHGQFQNIKDPITTLGERQSQHFRNKAFFESYFSNFIEGTTFEIEEAEEIIFQNKIPSDRPQDSHDITGTFQIVSDLNEMHRTPMQFSQLESILKNRHQVLMSARPEDRPGQYKEKPNRAGSTHFTPPELVQGTLEKGFDRYLSLPPGLPRAIFILFLISEVHPFKDRNGRVARMMMNAELVSVGLATIIIPTVFRDDYLLSLRALTRNHRPSPLIQALTYAQLQSALDFTDFPKILKSLQNHNWFQEPNDAKWLKHSN